LRDTTVVFLQEKGGLGVEQKQMLRDRGAVWSPGAAFPEQGLLERFRAKHTQNSIRQRETERKRERQTKRERR
jgi:hypothetical protein